MSFAEALRRPSLDAKPVVLGKPASNTTRPESFVLSETSLRVLAKELAKTPESPVVFLMYLNIPTTTIIHSCIEVSELGIKDADNETLAKFTLNMLLFWKAMRATARDKEKVNDLERSLKEMGNVEMAEVVKEKHTINAELSPEDFPQ